MEDSDNFNQKGRGQLRSKQIYHNIGYNTTVFVFTLLVSKEHNANSSPRD